MQSLQLEQIHIDVVRNATDDFNPFHDPQRWQHIRGNPFGGPVALGFQLAGLALHRIAEQRRANGEAQLAATHGLHYSNYQFTFAGAVPAGGEVEVSVRRTANRIHSNGELSNRVLVKHAGRAVLIGQRRDTREPGLPSLPPLPDSLSELPDRHLLPDGRLFLKRKHLMTSNGKNFCVGCLIPQHRYFDELAEKIYFPPAFVLSLVSCALLERARAEGHDFEAHPYVYTAHAFSFDKRVQRRLQSNDRLHLLVGPPQPLGADSGLGGIGIPRIRQTCHGILNDATLVFGGHVELAELGDLPGAAAGQASTGA